jgi:taurine dioxygenase
MTTDLTVHKIGEALGAVVAGIRLGPEIDDSIAVRLNDLLNEHQVLFFRGQDHLTDGLELGVATRLGVPTAPHPTVRSDTDLLPIEGAANSWHTDVSFIDRIPKASILRAVTLPTYGGATQWASTTAAYERLPDPLRVLAETLRAVHSNDYDYVTSTRYRSAEEQERYHSEFISTVFQTEHPVVRVHPETGKRALLLGHFVKKFVGVHTSDSSALFDVLQRHAVNPDHTVRWSWAPGDVAIWDNRATQHYGVNDFGRQVRRLQRVTLAGDLPVGIDGRTSVVLEGDASHYSPIVEARVPAAA